MSTAIAEPGHSSDPAASRWQRIRTPGRLITPVGVLLVLTGLFAWVGSRDLDSIEQRTLNADYIITNTLQHAKITFVAGTLVVLIAIPLGVVASRSRVLAPVILALGNVGQAVPVIGLMAMLTIVFGIGFTIAMVGIVLYALLPTLRNTVVGLQQVDPATVEAARGVGMTDGQILRRIEFPLAVPVILAGLRTALVLCVGVAVLATFVNAGGLGDIIVNGIKLQRMTVLVTGSVVTAVIALLVDWLGGLAEDLLRPRGM